MQILLEQINIRTENVDIRSKEEMYKNQVLTVFKAGILEQYCSHLLNMAIYNL